MTPPHPNPFEVPDASAIDPLACPLEPRRVPGHADRFANVGGALRAAETAEQQFRQHLSVRAAFDRHGRIVVIGGDRGTGKTTLRNRCVESFRSAWAERRAAEQFRLVDLAERRSKTEEGRLQLVRASIADANLPAFLTTADQVAALADGEGGYQRFFEQLGQYLVRQDQVLAVVLPPRVGERRHLEELDTYRDFAAPRVYFLAEVHNPPGVVAAWVDPSVAEDPERVIGLTTSTLTPDDAADYFEVCRRAFKALCAERGIPSPPPALVPAEAAEFVGGRQIPVATLQKIAGGTWAELANRPEPPPVLGCTDLIRFMNGPDPGGETKNGDGDG